MFIYRRYSLHSAILTLLLLTIAKNTNAGESDEAVLCARLHSYLCSCCGSDEQIASVTLELLENNSAFPARAVESSETDYWTILQRSPGGRRLAGRLYHVYKNSLGDHPYLTESQIILLRAATMLAHDASGNLESPSIFARACVLAGDLCEQKMPTQDGHETLFILPFYELAHRIETETKVAITNVEHAYKINTQGLHFIFPYQTESLRPQDLKAMHDRFANAAEQSAGETLKGHHAIQLHSLGLACAALTLLDSRGDDTLKWDVLKNAEETEFPALIQSLCRINVLLQRYQAQAESIARTAVPPNEDKLNLAIRNALRKPIDQELVSAKSLIDRLFDTAQPKDIPIALLDQLLIPANYEAN